MNPRNRIAFAAAGVLVAAGATIAVLYGNSADPVHEGPESAAESAADGPAALAELGAVLAVPVEQRAPGAPDSLGGVVSSEGAPPAPDAVFFDADGAEKTLADFQGKFVVLNLWATWCAPCVAELPMLAHAQELLGEDALILPVDMEKKEVPEISAFLEAKGAGTLPTYIDFDYKLMSAFEAFAVGLPYTIFIDAEGNEVARASGPQHWDDPEAVAYIRQMAMGG
jgi:thiol-disulfide isomerase/thioredoxin